VAAGAVISIYAGVLGTFIVSAFSNARNVIGIPLVGPALIVGTFVAELAHDPALAGRTDVIVFATAACVLLVGLWQILFAVLRIAELIKYVPHPVLAGFLNGFGLLIFYSQVAPHIHAIHSTGALGAKAELFAFMLALVVFILVFPRIAVALRAPFLNRIP